MCMFNLSPELLLENLETLGFLFEALCERHLRIYADSINASLFHYQDNNGKEINAVVEVADGRRVAIEIKLGANQIDAAARSLLSIQKKLKEDPKAYPPEVLCVLCGLSNAAYQRSDGVYVITITALKD